MYVVTSQCCPCLAQASQAEHQPPGIGQPRAQYKTMGKKAKQDHAKIFNMLNKTIQNDGIAAMVDMMKKQPWLVGPLVHCAKSGFLTPSHIQKSKGESFSHDVTKNSKLPIYFLEHFFRTTLEAFTEVQCNSLVKDKEARTLHKLLYFCCGLKPDGKLASPTKSKVFFLTVLEQRHKDLGDRIKLVKIAKDARAIDWQSNGCYTLQPPLPDDPDEQGTHIYTHMRHCSGTEAS